MRYIVVGRNKCASVNFQRRWARMLPNRYSGRVRNVKLKVTQSNGHLHQLKQNMGPGQFGGPHHHMANLEGRKPGSSLTMGAAIWWKISALESMIPASQRSQVFLYHLNALPLGSFFHLNNDTAPPWKPDVSRKS